MISLNAARPIDPELVSTAGCVLVPVAPTSSLRRHRRLEEEEEEAVVRPSEHTLISTSHAAYNYAGTYTGSLTTPRPSSSECTVRSKRR